MPIGPKDSRAVGKQKMLNYVMRVGTKAAENNLQRLIAARPWATWNPPSEMARIRDRETAECMWKSVATAHENRSWMGHATNVESFWLAGASSATPPLPQIPPPWEPHNLVRTSLCGDFPIVFSWHFSVFGSQSVRKNLHAQIKNNSDNLSKFYFSSTCPTHNIYSNL